LLMEYERVVFGGKNSATSWSYLPPAATMSECVVTGDKEIALLSKTAWNVMPL
jgi:hypothetical protein